MHDKAYGNIVYPCRDKTEWERMNGPVVLAPLFKKHVGRPTKSRRKAPHEVDARGGKKMTRHGVIMHCSYCGLPDHKKSGCKWLKSGLPPPNAQDLNVPPPQTEPTVTQEQNPVLNNPNAQNPIAEDLVVDTLIHEVNKEYLVIFHLVQDFFVIFQFLMELCLYRSLYRGS